MNNEYIIRHIFSQYCNNDTNTDIKSLCEIPMVCKLWYNNRYFLNINFNFEYFISILKNKQDNGENIDKCVDDIVFAYNYTNIYLSNSKSNNCLYHINKLFQYYCFYLLTKFIDNFCYIHPKITEIFAKQQTIKSCMKNANNNIIYIIKMHIIKNEYHKLKSLLSICNVINVKNFYKCFNLICELGRTKMFDLIISSSYKNVNNNILYSNSNNLPIRLACRNGCITIVKLLQRHKKVHFNTKNNYCIKIACKKGYYKIVKLLLTSRWVDPSVDDNYCIKIACKNGHPEIVGLLKKDPRVICPTNLSF